MPLIFVPPQGTCEKHGCEQLTHTIPVFISLASLSLREVSDVRIAAIKEDLYFSEI
jgi:hypothetical protein